MKQEEKYKRKKGNWKIAIKSNKSIKVYYEKDFANQQKKEHYIEE